MTNKLLLTNTYRTILLMLIALLMWPVVGYGQVGSEFYKKRLDAYRPITDRSFSDSVIISYGLDTSAFMLMFCNGFDCLDSEVISSVAVIVSIKDSFDYNIRVYNKSIFHFIDVSFSSIKSLEFINCTFTWGVYLNKISAKKIGFVNCHINQTIRIEGCSTSSSISFVQNNFRFPSIGLVIINSTSKNLYIKRNSFEIDSTGDDMSLWPHAPYINISSIRIERFTGIEDNLVRKIGIYESHFYYKPKLRLIGITELEIRVSTFELDTEIYLKDSTNRITMMYNTFMGDLTIKSDEVIDHFYAQNSVFKNVKIPKYTTLRRFTMKDCSINQNLKLDNVNISYPLSFINTILPDSINLENAKINYPIDLSSCTSEISYACVSNLTLEMQESNIYNLLTNDIDPVKIDCDTFYRRSPIVVSCYGIGDQAILMDYNYFTVDKSYENKDKVAAQYEILLNGFRKQGFTDSYKLCDMEYQKFKAFEQGEFFDQVAYWFKKGWWNLGYSRHWILYWTLGFFSIFYLVSYRCLGELLYNVYTIKKIEQYYSSHGKYYRPSYFDSLWTRMTLSFYYTALIFFGIRMTHENFYYKNFGWTIYIYFVFTSGIVCLGFLANWIITG